MELLQISKEDFREAIQAAVQAGRDGERDRIIRALNQDAVIQTCLSVLWLTYLVQMIEGED